MSKEREILFNYISSIIILFLLISLIMIFNSKPPCDRRKYNILMDLPDGLISVPLDVAVNELNEIKNNLSRYQTNVNDECAEIRRLIDEAMDNLYNFIDENPGSLCNLDKRSDIIKENLHDSITPFPIDWKQAYRTIVEYDSNEIETKLDTKYRFTYMLKNIDIIIGLMNNKICSYGRIDMNKLYLLLSKLGEEFCNESNDIPYYQRKVHHYNPTKSDMFLLKHISKQLPESFTSGNRNSVKYSGEGKNNILDNSIEGITEKDILYSRNPGHSISMIEDPYIHYTTRVNSCLGKTVPDDELWEQCTSYDMKYKKALDGDSSYMIDLRGSYHE